MNNQLTPKENCNTMLNKIKQLPSICKDTIIKNWQSGREGKVFLVATAFVIGWLIYPIFCGSRGSASTHGVAPHETSLNNSPTSLVKHYYKAFEDGNVEEYVNCVNYTDEQKKEEASSLGESFQNDEWRENVRKLYGEITMGVPKWTGDGKMSVKVAIENREHGGESNKEWYLIKINGRWLIDAEMTTNPHEMGL